MKKNIVLIGMMGTYKSTVAKVLSQKLGMMYLDCDDMLEFDLSMSVAKMFSEYGEEFFRKHERELLTRISEYENSIISCGGGAVLFDEGMSKIKDNAIVILMYATPKTIFKRIRYETNRPLIDIHTSEESIVNLWYSRKEKYYKYADVVVNTNGLSSRRVSERVVEALTRMANGEEVKKI